ncbi:MAG TPA: hypothetical protein EYM29_04045 [Rhodospirillales bacterium]|nr:hypothetical protein [Rhodospirillales bacterium]
MVLEYSLSEIRIPVVIAHHRNDNCFVTPPHNVDDLVDALKNAKVLALHWYEGGPDSGPSCQAAGHHGFAALEQKVIYDIATTIKSSLPSAH